MWGQGDLPNILEGPARLSRGQHPQNPSAVRAGLPVCGMQYERDSTSVHQEIIMIIVIIMVTANICRAHCTPSSLLSASQALSHRLLETTDREATVTTTTATNATANCKCLWRAYRIPGRAKPFIPTTSLNGNRNPRREIDYSYPLFTGEEMRLWE